MDKVRKFLENDLRIPSEMAKAYLDRRAEDTGLLDGEDGIIYLEGPILTEESAGFLGAFYDGPVITPKGVRNALSEQEGDIEIRLNSPGGQVTAGAAVVSELSNYGGGKITVAVTGLAASMASVVAVAGNETIMYQLAEVMIHNPHMVVIGEAADLEKAAEMLRGVEDRMVSLYASRTGEDEGVIRKWMAAETFLGAEDAVKAGFASSIRKMPERDARDKKKKDKDAALAEAQRREYASMRAMASMSMAASAV